MFRAPFRTLAVASFLLAPLHGCDTDDGGDDADGGADAPTCAESHSDVVDYAVGLEGEGNNGLVSIEFMSATPAPPGIKENTWEIMLHDVDGAGLAGAELLVTPFMPEHGHGTPVGAEVTDNGDGSYTLDPVHFLMEGYWTVTVDVTLPDDGGEDSVVFAFCIGDA